MSPNWISHDAGRGMSRQETAGHYGVAGMRERAALMRRHSHGVEQGGRRHGRGTVDPVGQRLSENAKAALVLFNVAGTDGDAHTAWFQTVAGRRPHPE